MGFLSRLWKGVKKVVKKIGKGIKKVVKKIGGAFGKLGILGHIGLMFLMPYASQFWGSLGKFGTTLVNGTNIAGKAFGHVMRGVYHAGKAVGTVYKTITGAIEGSVKWLGNKAANFLGAEGNFFGDPWKSLDKVMSERGEWIKDGWAGTNEMASKSVLDAATANTVSGTNVKSFDADAVNNIGKMTAPPVDIPDRDWSQVDLSDISASNKESSLLSKGQDYLEEVWDEAKGQFSPKGMADTVTEGLKGGLKQKAAEVITGETEFTTNYGGPLAFAANDTGQILEGLDQTAQGYSYGASSLQNAQNQGWIPQDYYYTYNQELEKTLNQ
jgi:hypothetical protein